MVTTTTPSLGELAERYAESPGPQTLGALRTTVRGAANFGADARLRAEVAAHRAAGDDEAVVRSVRAAMPGAFFSPGAHGLLAQAYAALGDEERAGRERRIARLALASVLRTGDGTAERPWSVLHLADEYDVLQAIGRTSTAQRLVRRGERRYDVHTCGADELWFDVTALPRRRAGR